MLLLLLLTHYSLLNKMPNIWPFRCRPYLASRGCSPKPSTSSQWMCVTKTTTTTISFPGGSANFRFPEVICLSGPHVLQRVKLRDSSRAQNITSLLRVHYIREKRFLVIFGIFLRLGPPPPCDESIHMTPFTWYTRRRVIYNKITEF